MLNTESRPVAFFVWSAISLIVLLALWSLFRWPSLGELWRMYLDSGLPQTILIYQTLIGLLAGAGVIAAAYLINGRQDRHAALQNDLEFRKNFKNALAIEIRDLGVKCRAVSAEAVGLAEKLHSESGSHFKREIAEAQEKFRRIDLSESLLLSLSSDNYLMLESSLYRSLKLLKKSAKALESSLTSFPEAGASSADYSLHFERLARDCIVVSLACDRLERIFQLSPGEWQPLPAKVPGWSNISSHEIEAALLTARGNRESGRERLIAKAAE